jgi:hypothetical protein
MIRNNLTKNRPGLYVMLVIATIIGAKAFELRRWEIFACQAYGYSADLFAAYCGGARYVDTEHGIFWYGLDSSITNNVREADAIFLGNSRALVAFSANSIREFFKQTNAKWYNLAFAYEENSAFETKLLRKLEPLKAHLFVVNLEEQFFDDQETRLAAYVMHDPRAEQNYINKQRWQVVHKPICNTLPRLCGHSFVIWRSRENGRVIWDPGNTARKGPVSYDETTIDQNEVDRSVAVAKRFIEEFGRDRCIIFTTIPTMGTRLANSAAIADALRIPLIIPTNINGLSTFDTVHLDPASVERWSLAFLDAANDQIRECLAKPSGVASDGLGQVRAVHKSAEASRTQVPQQQSSQNLH